MSLVLAVHFKRGIYEFFLPGQNNRRIGVAVPASIAGYSFNVPLAFEVWNGVWQIRETSEVAIYKDSCQKAAVVLEKGLVLICEHCITGENFSIVVDENYAGYSDFDKYLLKRGKLSIGSSEGNIIRYDAQNLVSGRHTILDVASKSECTVIDDNSSNGTFVNGKRITGGYKLEFGDVIYIIGLKIVYLGELIAINRPSAPVLVHGLIPYKPQQASTPDAGGQGLSGPAATLGLGRSTAASGLSGYTAAPGLNDPADTPGLGRSTAAPGLSGYTATPGLSGHAATPGLSGPTATPGSRRPGIGRASAVDGYYRRSPRRIEPFDDETIEIEAPPNPNKQRRQPLIFTIGPPMTMVIPMAAGVLFTMWSMQQSAGGIASPFMFMGIITSVTAALIGVTWALANYRYNKKMERDDEERRCNRYRAYLNGIRELLEEKRDCNKKILNEQFPHASECLGFVKTKSRRLWERNVNHLDFLTLRLGQGETASPNCVVIPKERFSLIDDSLMDEPKRIKTEFEKLSDTPICISLREHSLIGVIGDKQWTCNKIARLIAVQVAAYHAYTDVRMAFVFNRREAADYEFARWLPHTWNAGGSLRMMAYDENSTGEVFYELASVLRKRMEECEQAKDSGRPLPHYIVFISNPDLAENEAAMKYISSPTEQMGLTTIMLYNQIDRLPNNCTVIIQHDEEYRGYYSLDGSFPGFVDVVFDEIDYESTNEFSRNLSNIRVRELHSSGAAPQLLTFLDMFKSSNVGAINIERRWLENRTFESMKAMIGFRGADTPLFLDIHEKYHGPHGLVAGTTGSGKSELLQTYILSLSLNYHPYEVSFILIDYKGGGMAGSFEGLPHVAGIITNLGGNQTNRALASINSEIKRRQAILNEYKQKHIDGYIELFRAGKVLAPMPHLIIIADEFAELKKEQPEFVRELVSASRVGRSLGVHLILATQKPSGVVDDEIWGNSKFRLCLRVQDKQDSNEMIRRPDAAYITNAGRGYFQVGNDEIFEMFQSGWSGAAYEPEIAYTDAKQDDAALINLLGKPSVVGSTKKAPHRTSAGAAQLARLDASANEKRQTQLEAAVMHISRTAAKMGVKAIENIWLPPLPKCVSLEDLAPFAQSLCQEEDRNPLGAQRIQLGEQSNTLGVHGALPGAQGDTHHLQTQGEVAQGDITPAAYQWHGLHGELNPIVGIADDPVNQRQAALSIDIPTEGHLLIVGSGGSGKTTFLQTLLFSLVTSYSPKQLHIYIADFGSRTMGVFGSLPHVGGVVFDNEIDKADKLVALLLNELNRRKRVFSEKGAGSIKEYLRLHGDVPFIVFALDNYAAWSEACGKQEDNLVQLSREAASYGIYLAITCSNTNDMRNKMRQNISFGIGLQLADRFEYEEVIGAKTDIIAEGRTPGRGLVCSPTPLEFQTALCLGDNSPAPFSEKQGYNGTASFSKKQGDYDSAPPREKQEDYDSAPPREKHGDYDTAPPREKHGDYDTAPLSEKLKERFDIMASAWAGDCAPRIPQVPADMSLSNIMRLGEFRSKLESASHLPIAYDLAEARLTAIDLSKTFCYTISGAARSGKTNMLKAIMRIAIEQDGLLAGEDEQGRGTLAEDEQMRGSLVEDEQGCGHLAEDEQTCGPLADDEQGCSTLAEDEQMCGPLVDNEQGQGPGRTNMRKCKLYVFDSVAHELEDYSRELGIDGYITSSGELFDLMQETIIPEFSRRNKKKAECLKSKRKSFDEFAESETKILLFINDMTAFCEAVYGSERDMKGFMEQMIARGNGHMICLFACVSHADMAGEYNSKRLIRGFIGWKEGLHLGGKLEDQRIFDFDAPILERGKKLPAGYGHTTVGGTTKRIVTPLVE